MIFPIATRAQAVTLKNCGYSWENIEKQTGVGRTQLRYIIREAKKRGYDPEKSLALKDEYFHDGYRTGRPLKLSEEQVQALIAASKTKEGARRKTNAQLAKEFGVSERTVRRFKEVQGEYKRPAYRPQRKDFPATIAQARASTGEAEAEAEAQAQAQSQTQSQADADADADGDLSMVSRPSAEEPSTFEDALLEQLRKAATTGIEYGEANSPSISQIPSQE